MVEEQKKGEFKVNVRDVLKWGEEIHNCQKVARFRCAVVTIILAS
jgi:hypothetical protein